MTGTGVTEKEWRKISDATEAVEMIHAKYAKLLELMKGVAVEQAKYVQGLLLVAGDADGVFVLKSFAGDSHIRLGWDASGEDLAGVAIFTSLKHGSPDPKVTLKVYLPWYSERAYLILDDGQRLSMNSIKADDFAYIVLMNAVRRQVDLSNQ